MFRRHEIENTHELARTAMAGVPIERIADYPGHSTIRLTMIYPRFRPHDDFDAPLVELAHAIASGRSLPRRP